MKHFQALKIADIFKQELRDFSRLSYVVFQCLASWFFDFLGLSGASCQNLPGWY